MFTVIITAFSILRESFYVLIQMSHLAGLALEKSAQEPAKMQIQVSPTF